MSTLISSESTAGDSRSPLLGWLAVGAVAMGIFSIVTTEIMPIGLLTSIGSSFDISDGTAGLMMTMPGFLAAISAPTLTVATKKLDRRSMLIAFMVLLAAANFLAAIAPAYWVILVSRVIVGITIGGFWSISAGLAARLVRPESITRATAVIFSAVPLGSVVGVPAGTLIGDLAGWRTTFVVMGFLTLSVLTVIIAVVPPLPPGQVTRLSVLRRMLGHIDVRVGLLATFLIVVAHFATYTYLTPFLRHVTDIGAGTVTWFLLVYGIAGVVGNFVGGSSAARHPRATFGAAAAMIATATLLLPAVGESQAGTILLLAIWGLGYGAVPVCSQTWFVKSAPHTPEAASVLFTASFQATLSLGALTGGVIVDHTTPSTVMLLGGTTAILMVLVVWTHFVKRIPWPDNH